MKSNRNKDKRILIKNYYFLYLKLTFLSSVALRQTTYRDIDFSNVYRYNENNCKVSY